MPNVTAPFAINFYDSILEGYYQRLKKISVWFIIIKIHVKKRLNWVSYLFNQTFGLNNIKIGYISSLPTNIAKINVNFDNQLNGPKFPAGPTSMIALVASIGPNPGPILFIHAVTAVIFVVKSNPLRETIKKQEIKIIMNIVK